jgi:hypothetical protein
VADSRLNSSYLFFQGISGKGQKMSSIGDFFKGVAQDTLRDLLGKASRKLTRRRRRRARPKTATATIRAIEKLLRPAKRQVSRRATNAARSKVRRVR